MRKRLTQAQELDALIDAMWDLEEAAGGSSRWDQR